MEGRYVRCSSRFLLGCPFLRLSSQSFQNVLVVWVQVDRGIARNENGCDEECLIQLSEQFIHHKMTLNSLIVRQDPFYILEKIHRSVRNSPYLNLKIPVPQNEA
jgi:hypothetical protein